MPAVRGDRAYALSTDHHVVALSLDDGTEQWRRSTGESGWITEGFRVVVAGDAVIAGANGSTSLNNDTSHGPFALQHSTIHSDVRIGLQTVDGQFSGFDGRISPAECVVLSQ